jgi:hypothetical protein
LLYVFLKYLSDFISGIKSWPFSYISAQA